MKRFLLIIVTVLSFETAVFSQGANPFWDRMRFGGNVGLSFSNRGMYLELSPTAMYALTERFYAGVGGKYQYLKNEYRFPSKSVTLETSVYGGSVLGRYGLTEEFFAMAEIEMLSADYFVRANEKKRDWTLGTFLGGGYLVPLGGRGEMFFAALYNFSYDDVKSPYLQPYVLRVGFNL